MIWRVEQGDCLQVLKILGTDSVDLVVTDPPYGISFMGKKWDEALPNSEVWSEVLRVLKPGAFAFVMCIPRADCSWRLMAALEQAGFLIHFTPIYWAYASGFPKAQNIAKFIEKRHREPDSIEDVDGCGGMTSDKGYNVTKHHEHYDELTHPDAIRLEGSYGGFQPKPAVEVIVVAMKPLSEKTFVDQALKNGKGVTWMDDCRVPFISKKDGEGKYGFEQKSSTKFKQIKQGAKSQKNKQGRFPANLLCSDDVLNDGKESKGSHNVKYLTEKESIFGVSGTKTGCVDGFNDSGSFSRYFDLDAWWQKKLESMPDSVKKCFPFLIVPKPSKTEKNKGCETLPERQVKGGGGLNNTEDDVCGKYGSIKAKQHNPHPTVKPVKLMSYLIELGSRKGDLIVDPFAGSGTTGIAAVLLERNSICIELDKDHAETAKARIGKVAEYIQKSLF